MRETSYHLVKGPGISIALVSDLHRADPAPVIESLRRRRPDLVAVTGDMINWRLNPEWEEGMPFSRRFMADLDPFLAFAKECAAIAPTCFSLGNHEWMVTQKDIEQISRTGVTVLDNQWVRFPFGTPDCRDVPDPLGTSSRPILVGGLTSAALMDYRANPDKEGWLAVADPMKADTAWLDEFERQDAYKVLLCHHPEYWPRFLKNRKIDLVLSGHAHGGQIRLPGRGLYAPGQGFFPRYTSGIYNGRFGSLVVSRGLANTVKGVPRLFNPTEVVYL